MHILDPAIGNSFDLQPPQTNPAVQPIAGSPKALRNVGRSVKKGWNVIRPAMPYVGAAVGYYIGDAYGAGVGMAVGGLFVKDESGQRTNIPRSPAMENAHASSLQSPEMGPWGPSSAHPPYLQAPSRAGTGTNHGVAASKTNTALLLAAAAGIAVVALAK